MAISYISSGAGTNTGTLGSFLPGDICIVFAFRDGSTTNPTVPGTFNTISNTTDGTSCSASIGWRRLVEGDTSIGTWTNASRTAFAVYRGCEPFITPIGGVLASAGTTNTVSWGSASVTMTRTDGTSWIAGFGGHRSVNTTIDSAAISSMTARGGGVDANAEAVVWDSNAGVASWASRTQTIAGTASGWQTYMVELLAMPTQTPADVVSPWRKPE